jgi:predicted dehydrogenase
MSDVLRVGMVGYAFMGAAHAQAWRNAHRFFELPLIPELTAVAGRNPEAVSAAAERLGYASTETDWHKMVERDDIDLVDICTPVTATPRSQSLHCRPASMCCARSRWRTPSRRQSRW